MTPGPFRLDTTPLEPGITLLEASAGTGKTFAIAGLYLRLLLEAGLDVSQILVVTFTEAATSELRGRIRERLSEARRILREGSTPDPLWRQLLLTGLEEARGPRLKRLESALEQFDRASVFTIHGFCRRTLKRCAFETGALFDAELQPDVEALVEEAADNFWRRQFYGAPTRHLLYAVHGGLSAESLARLLRRHLQQAEPELLPIAGGQSLRAVLEAADAAFADAAAVWTEQRAEIVAQFGASGGGWGNSPYNSDAKMEPEFAALDALFGGTGTGAGLAAVGLMTPEALSGKASKRSTRPVPAHPFFERCRSLERALVPVAAAIRHALLTSAPAELARLKDRDRTLGFDDLLRQVADALRGPRGDRLAESLRSEHRAALIDEFQDTDPLQWSLFERAFADGGTHLYLVGDPKQAIYSFRGADVFAYLRARDHARRRFTLGENWRSARTLVSAVNGVFGEHPLPFALKEIGFHPVTAAGRADRTPLSGPGPSSAPLQVWCWDSDAEGATTGDERTARLAAATAEEIVRLLSSGTRLGERPLAPGDVAVLVDTHDQAAAVAAELGRRRVPCVRQTQESVFATREAGDLQTLLNALCDGAGEAERRAALVTDLVGLDPSTLAALAETDGAWDAWRDRLATWGALWARDGVLPMLETALRACGTRPRLLSAPGGERRLTNYLHLGELLQQSATARHRTPRSLAGWLSEQRTRAGEDSRGAEETLLRLERDAEAVQVVTIHRSKGLEYAVVFCPFPGRAADQGLQRSGRYACETVLFHNPDADGRLQHDVGTPEFEDHRRLAVGEAFAESLRLLYVALTRAQHRCYFGWTLGGKSAARAAAWLLCPPPDTAAMDLSRVPEALAAHVGGLSPDELRAGAEARSGAEAAVMDLPDPGETQWHQPGTDAEPAEARVFRGTVRRDWGVASFSSLALGSGEDRSGTPGPDEVLAMPPPADGAGGPLAAFRGTRAGICLHEVFEVLDFRNDDDEAVRDRVEARLEANGFPTAPLAEPLAALITTVLDAPLFEGGSLRGVSGDDCWRELEFLLPLRPVSPASLAAAFAAGPEGATGTALAPSLARLGFADVRGMLGGFVDLIVRSGGRWWLLDWKSNWLGESPEAYGREALEREMAAQGYGLQYHLYLLALNRLLKARIPGYDYERDFGGVRYVFVRGVTAGRPDLGVFADRPPAAMLDLLEERLLEVAP